MITNVKLGSSRCGSSRIVEHLEGIMKVYEFQRNTQRMTWCEDVDVIVSTLNTAFPSMLNCIWAKNVVYKSWGCLPVAAPWRNWKDLQLHRCCLDRPNIFSFVESALIVCFYVQTYCFAEVLFEWKKMLRSWLHLAVWVPHRIVTVRYVCRTLWA